MNRQIMSKTAMFLIIILSILGCSKDDDGNSDNNPSEKLSLPVKAISKDANGNVIKTITYTYDSQKRTSTMNVIDKNPDLNATTTYNYENGKITMLKDYDNSSKPLEKKIYFYNSNGMVKEEEYMNNSLAYINEWFHRPDGGKERRIKNPSGHLFETWYYRFTSAGNIERVVLDYTDNADEDIEYTFSNYDNKQRAAVSYMNSVLPAILMEIEGTKLSLTNNPQTFTQKEIDTGNLIADMKIEYLYNTRGQVIQMKTFKTGTINLLGINTIEYKEF